MSRHPEAYGKNQLALVCRGTNGDWSPTGATKASITKNTGKEKLRRDSEGGLFFDHRDNLRRVDLRYAHGSSMKEFFTKWLKEYPDPYPRNRRYRKNIPFQWVQDNGILLMTLTDGEVTYPKTAPR